MAEVWPRSYPVPGTELHATKDSDRYRFANSTKAQPLFRCLARLERGKVIPVSVLSDCRLTSTRRDGSGQLLMIEPVACLIAKIAGDCTPAVAPGRRATLPHASGLARHHSGRIVAEREEPTETGLGSTARCCGRRRHRQANSVRVCSPTSRRVASLRPRSAGLTALTSAPRTLV